MSEIRGQDQSFEYKGEATCYNRAPTALPQTLETNEDTSLPFVLTGTDPENDALTYTVIDAPKHGTLSGTAPNLVYTPAANYHGPDSFTFRVQRATSFLTRRRIKEDR